MNAFGTRGAAEDFARALDSGSTASAPGGALVAQLRGTGMSLQASVVPRPEFRDALRTRLMAVATVQAAAPATAPTSAPTRALEAAVSWRRRGSAVAAGAMASVVAVSGVAVAGSQSLPGDPFYGVKRTAEAFQLRTAGGDLEKGTRHLDFAATRLREVRGLTLGRDAVDAGPRLGPSALASGITLSSSSQPLAAGSALSAPVAVRVRETLAEMDAQTREGANLLTAAYRTSRTPSPLRTLSRFATRQSTGLEQLIPALPPATQSRARLSLALLTDVEEQTDELLGIGTCRLGCDPSQAAPTAPSSTGTGSESPADAPADCDCAAPAPAPAPQPSATPPSAEPEPEPTRAPAPSASPSPRPSPSPSPSPSSGLPVPVPVPVPTLPVPVPTLPAPVPSITIAPLTVQEPLAPVLPGANSSSTAQASGPAPTPAPASTPVPQLAPAPAPTRP